MNYEIQWRNTSPQRQYEPQLRAEIREFMDGDPSGLVSHTMMVDGAEYGSNGPSVSAAWSDEFGCVVAEFNPVTEWASLDEIEDG